MSPLLAQVTVIKDGKALATIYLDRDPALPAPTKGGGRATSDDQARNFAVTDLQYHLKQMSGVELPVVVTADAKAITGPAIVLGKLAESLGATVTKTTESGEGYRLLVQGERLLIAGQSERGVMLGVYDVLESLGCEWVMPGAVGEIIPKRATVTLPAVDRAEAPGFLVRRLWYRGYRQPRLPRESQDFAIWLRRQRGGTWEHPLMGAGGHVWDAFIKRHQKEFEADPTMYALRRAPDGTMKRMGPQLETTHPRVIELFVKEIKDKYAANIAAGTWTAETRAAFGIGPADGLGYSMSPESLAVGAGRLDPIVGELDRTDELVLFANRILEEVNKEYPNAHVGCYSYSTHADFPIRHQPNPRLVQIFAPINFSRLHGALDPHSKTQAYYRGVVEQWGRLSQAQGNPLFYRGYSWNLAENMMPYSKLRIWGEEIPWYHRMGILGSNVEGDKQWGVNGPSDWLYMKLLWQPAGDWQALLKEYCASAFGAGAPAMERYLLRLTERQHSAGMEAGSYHSFALIYDLPWVAEAEKDFAEALGAAKEDAEKTRIGYLQHTLQALKLYLQMTQALHAHDFAGTRKLYDALHAHWQAGYDANTDTVSNETPHYLRRFMESVVMQGETYSKAPYKMVLPIPDELHTMFDPTQNGHRLRYQSPDITDKGFLKTKTFSSTWDAQGLSGLRTGSVWYRWHFTLPEAARGQPLGLYLGSFEDEARVWINGTLIGTSGRQFSRPALFDLTEGVKAEGDNLLAIQVIRNSAANEIGLGGLIRPSYIFTGPRLATKAPNTVELRRVLPGGELGPPEQ